MSQGRIFKGDNKRDADRIKILLDTPPPPWRSFSAEAKRHRGKNYQASKEEIEVVNAALYLRRPLLVTGKPGTGKTSLAYAVQYELGLEDVLVWPITTTTTLQQGLYYYDAIARLQDSSLAKNQADIARLQDSPLAENQNAQTTYLDIGKYVRLGPLGTALLSKDKPKVLLIDEIDKSDIDFPNELLHVFEEGSFIIPEIARLPDEQKSDDGVIVKLHGNHGVTTVPMDGQVNCEHFPLVIMTSNNERDFPPAFLRRCLRLNIQLPSEQRLKKIVQSRLEESSKIQEDVQGMIDYFLEQRNEKNKELATDQLLNALFLVLQDYPLETNLTSEDKAVSDGIDKTLKDIILQALNE